jgi:4-hydroxy-tetrahydrodipicolinate synthase
MPMLLMGCDGGTNATSGIAPALMRRLYETTRAGELDLARALQFKVRRLFAALFSAGDFPEGFRMGLALRGISTGAGRMPRSARQQELDRKARDELAVLFEQEELL